MGQGMDVMGTCDANSQKEGNRRNGHESTFWDEEGDNDISCHALEQGVKNAVASATRGGSKISNEVLLNHELLQHARGGNVRGLSSALEKGAWTETRRPLVMKPQKPERSRGNGNKEDSEPTHSHSGPGEGDLGMTALMFSAQNGSVECIRRLLWANAEVNAKEEDGWTALHFAAKDVSLEACGTLLEARADSASRNSDDKTPLQVAEEEDAHFARKLQGLIDAEG